MAARYILRFDDIAPNMRWDRFDRLERVVGDLGISPVIGVIPDNRDPHLLALPACSGDFWARIRDVVTRGWTLAMHGYQHRYVTNDGGMLGLGDKSEFAGLAREEQETKLTLGRAALEAQGLSTDVFMAPGHSFDRVTLDALLATGFRRVTDGLALRPFRDHGLLFVPVLSGAARRSPLGVWTFATHVNTLDDDALGGLESFLARHRDAFIGFDEAEQLVSDFPLNRPTGRLLRRASNLARTMRHAPSGLDRADPAVDDERNL